MNAETWKDTNPKDLVASNKVPLHLVPQSVNVAMAMAFLEGASKYGAFNWRATGVRASVYFSALQRHLTAWINGEEIDPDSGLPHTFKMAACVAIIIDAHVAGVLVDDRPIEAPIAAMMTALEPTVKAIKEKHADKNPRHYFKGDASVTPPVPPVAGSVVSAGFPCECRWMGLDSDERSGIVGQECIRCGGIIP